MNSRQTSTMSMCTLLRNVDDEMKRHAQVQSHTHNICFFRSSRFNVLLDNLLFSSIRVCTQSATALILFTLILVEFLHAVQFKVKPSIEKWKTAKHRVTQANTQTPRERARWRKIDSFYFRFKLILTLFEFSISTIWF